MGRVVLKKNRAGRCFKAHLKNKFGLLTTSKLLRSDNVKRYILADIAKTLTEKNENRMIQVGQSRDARAIGLKFEYPFGGSYQMVADSNKVVRDGMYLESNHSPPDDSYRGTAYDSQFAYTAKPAHAMLFYHHRAPRGSTGGLTSTGGSSFNKPWAEKLRELMKAGKFAEAMALDFNDVLATTTPNRGFYALALHRTALYARHVGLIDDAGLNQVAAVYSQYLTGPDLAEAFNDSEESV